MTLNPARALVLVGVVLSLGSCATNGAKSRTAAGTVSPAESDEAAPGALWRHDWTVHERTGLDALDFFGFVEAGTRVQLEQAVGGGPDLWFEPQAAFDGNHARELDRHGVRRVVVEFDHAEEPEEVIGWLALIEGLECLRLELRFPEPIERTYDLAGLSSCRELRWLDLSGSYSIQSLAFLGSLPALRVLSLSGAGFEAAELVHMAGAVGLRQLDLSGTNVRDADLAALATLQGLEVLDLGTTEVRGEGLVGLANAGVPLRALSLKSNVFGERSLAAVGRLSRLESLDLSHARGELRLAPLAELEVLERLNLCCTVGVDDDALEVLAGARFAARLVGLDLTGARISQRGISAVTSTMTRLHDLNLKGCSWLPAASLAGLSALGRLETLDVSGTKIDGRALGAIATSLRSLSELDLSNCSALGARDLLALTDLSSLERLDLSTTRVDDAVLVALSGSQTLREVTLYDCELVTPRGLAALEARSIEIRGREP